MKDTNAIEKALEKKIDLEISALVASFISQLQDLYDTYGGTSWYNIVYDAQEKEISCLSKEKVRNILEETKMDENLSLRVGNKIFFGKINKVKSVKK